MKPDEGEPRVRRMGELSEAADEMQRAITALALELPASVHDDIRKRWERLLLAMSAADELTQAARRVDAECYGMAFYESQEKAIDALHDALAAVTPDERNPE